MPIAQEHIVCPRCKHIFCPASQIITDTTLDIWQAAGPKFWRGKRMTLVDIANTAGYSISTTRRHLLRLCEVGLVQLVPLHGEEGGKQQKHAYKGCMFSKVA
jgi:hypothetical protein